MRKRKLFNKKEYKNTRRVLRKKVILAERLLWMRLRNKQLGGYRFRRQYGIGKYIVDFYCPKLKLAIEVDGSTHSKEIEIEYDKGRQYFIEKQGIKVLRYKNSDIYNYMDNVMLSIFENCEKRKTQL